MNQIIYSIILVYLLLIAQLKEGVAQLPNLYNCGDVTILIGDSILVLPPPTIILNDPPVSVDTVTKNIMFVHGLGGGLGSLSRLREATELGAPGFSDFGFKANTRIVSYRDVQFSLAGAGLLVRDDLVDKFGYNNQKKTYNNCS